MLSNVEATETGTNRVHNKTFFFVSNKTLVVFSWEISILKSQQSPI
jgi:hypothetical protein